MKDHLYEFLKLEIPWRLIEIIGVKDEDMDKVPVGHLVDSLYHNSDVVLNYDAIDEFICRVLDEAGVKY